MILNSNYSIFKSKFGSIKTLEIHILILFPFSFFFSFFFFSFSSSPLFFSLYLWFQPFGFSSFLLLWLFGFLVPWFPGSLDSLVFWFPRFSSFLDFLIFCKSSKSSWFCLLLLIYNILNKLKTRQLTNINLCKFRNSCKLRNYNVTFRSRVNNTSNNGVFYPPKPEVFYPPRQGVVWFYRVWQ